MNVKPEQMMLFNEASRLRRRYVVEYDERRKRDLCERLAALMRLIEPETMEAVKQR